MLHYEEEQQLELEALESLFPNEGEFIKLSSTELNMNLFPFPLKDQVNHVEVKLHITYPPTYPDISPIWKVASSRGLDETHLNELHQLIDVEINSSLGCPMLYMVAEAVQSFLRSHNKPPQSSYDQMMSRCQTTPSLKTKSTKQQTSSSAVVNQGLEDSDVDYEDDDDDDSDYSDSGSSSSDEESSNGGEFKGLEDKQLCADHERITEEQFKSWGDKFRAEMIAKGLWQRKIAKTSMLTGKQMFERDHSLAKTVDDALLLDDVDAEVQVEEDRSISKLNGSAAANAVNVTNIECFDEKLFIDGNGNDDDPDFSDDDDDE